MSLQSISKQEADALRDLVAAADSVETPLVAVGATARELVFNRRYGIASHRSTTDWDFGVFVGDWASFSRLKDATAVARRFNASPESEHKIIHVCTGLEVDLIPSRCGLSSRSRARASAGLPGGAPQQVHLVPVEQRPRQEKPLERGS